MVGGVCGWSARWLPSHSLVLFVHGGLWPGGVGWWAVVVVGVVLVVLVVGPLVMVALVTRSRGGPATGRCGTRASEQAGKALRSQGHQCAHVM